MRVSIQKNSLLKNIKRMDKLNPKIYQSIKDGEFNHYKAGYIPKEMLNPIADRCNDIFKHKVLSLKRIYGEKAAQMQYKQLKTNFINTLDQIDIDEDGHYKGLEKLVRKIIMDYFDFTDEVQLNVALDSSGDDDFGSFDDDNTADEMFDDYDTYINKYNISNRNEILYAFLVGAVESATKSIFNYIDDIESINERLGRNYAKLYNYIDYIYWANDDDLINKEIKIINGVDHNLHTPHSAVINVYTSNFVYGVKAAFLGVFSLLLGVDHTGCYGAYHWHKRIGEILYGRIMENCRDTANVKNIFRKIRKMSDDELKMFVKELLINSKKFQNLLK